MILGIGNDIVEIDRIRAVIARYPQRFINRLFTPSEQEYCLKRKDPALHFAGRFAAKEAVVKALGTGFTQNLTWLDIEIRHDSKGKPGVFFSRSSASLLGDPILCVSISHCHQYATAIAIWTQGKTNLRDDYLSAH
jgi:holo-[acyl-carrier protein] synthase